MTIVNCTKHEPNERWECRECDNEKCNGHGKSDVPALDEMSELPITQMPDTAYAVRERAESDPTGRDAHAPGAKLDHGKNRLGLVLGGFSRALQMVGEVGTGGAIKYTPNGWKEVPQAQERYTDAMMRHLFKELAGELRDPDTELLHAAHTAWNALARLEKLIEADRKKGSIAEVLDALSWR